MDPIEKGASDLVRVDLGSTVNAFGVEGFRFERLVGFRVTSICAPFSCMYVYVYIYTYIYMYIDSSYGVHMAPPRRVYTGFV